MRRALTLIVVAVAVACEADLPTARDLLFACTVNDECGVGTGCVKGVCVVVDPGAALADAGPVVGDAGIAVDAGPRDGGGAVDGGRVDAGAADAGDFVDGGAGDAGLVDDGGVLDAGTADAGAVDAGLGDAGNVPADWWDAAFTKRVRLDVVTGQVTGGPHGQFVALVSFAADASLATYAADDGRDVVFTTTAGARLSHELQAFDGAAGALIAWVRIPNVTAAEGASLWMYFGAPSAPAQQDPAATWGAEHAGVWHMDDPAAPVVDSSSHGNDGTPINLDGTNAAAGIVGGAIAFEGEAAQQSIDCGADASLDLASPLTTSAWVNLANADYDHFMRVLNKKNGWDACCGYDMEMHALMDRVGTITAGTFDVSANGTIQWAAGTWHHYVVVHDGALVRIYVDGVEVAGRTDAAPIQTGGGASLQIGSIGTRAYDFFYGAIDEVRVVSLARGPGRIATEHANQSDPASFFVVGPLESL